MKPVVIESDGVLVCPVCGNEYLHHGKIDVFSRNEDEKKCVHTTVNHQDTVVTVDEGKENPSSRRGGLTIRFCCESCLEASTLCVSQHKGITFVEWR